MSRIMIFNDDATGNPLFQASLPDTFVCRSRLTTTPNSDGTVKIEAAGIAMNQANGAQIYFGSGKAYAAQSLAQGSSVIIHPLCAAGDQLTELTSEYLGQNVSPLQQGPLPQELMQKLQQDGQKEVAKNLQIMNQVGSMGQIKIQAQCTGMILDGAMGIYPIPDPTKRMTMYSALWRMGFSFAAAPVGGMFGGMMNGMMGGVGQMSNTTWTVPYLFTMRAAGEPSQGDFDVFNEFIRTFELTPQLKSFVEQTDQNNYNIMLNQAAMAAQQTQAQISQAWAQHEANWARVDAMRQSLSQDLDRFRAGQAANAAAMDAFRDNLSSSGSYSSGFGGSGESLDDKVQRWRHESMMGVNTYEREDGSTYEHTIMDDRVFEHQFDQNQHFGTQNYHGDWIPDNWYEMNRKK